MTSSPTRMPHSETGRPEGQVADGFVSRVGKAAVWTQLLRIVEVGTSLLFLVAVVRRLGPAEYGAFNLIVSVTATCNMIALLGFHEALNKYVPEFAGKGRGEATAWIAQRILSAGLVLALLCCVSVWLFRARIAGALHYPGFEGLYPVIATLVIGQTVSALLSGLNLALWRAGVVFTITGLVNAASVLGAVWLVWTGRATGQAAAAASAVAFALGMAAFLIVSRQWIFARPRLKVSMAPIWRFAASVWLVRLSLFAMGSNVVVILMSWLLGDQREVAFFSCAYVPLFRLQALILGWSASVLPSLAEIKSRSGPAGLALPYRVYLKLTTAVATPALLFVAWYAEPLVVMLFGAEFAGAADSLRVFAVLSLAALLAGSGVTTMLLYSLGQARDVGLMRAAVAAAQLALSCWLMMRYGAMGAVISIGLAAVLAACLEIAMAPASLRTGYPIGFIAKTLIVSVLSISALSLMRPANIPGLVVVGTAYLAAYVLLLARWNPLDDREKRIFEGEPVVVRILALLRI